MCDFVDISTRERGYKPLRMNIRWFTQVCIRAIWKCFPNLLCWTNSNAQYSRLIWCCYFNSQNMTLCDGSQCFFSCATAVAVSSNRRKRFRHAFDRNFINWRLPIPLLVIVWTLSESLLQNTWRHSLSKKAYFAFIVCFSHEPRLNLAQYSHYQLISSQHAKLAKGF